MARKYGTNDEVMEAYANGDEKPWTNGNGSVYHNGIDTIYSYGTHFPLAYKNDENLYIINGDHYSVTTSSHQRAIQSILPSDKSFTMGFSALDNAGINYRKMKIRDHTQDQSDYAPWNDKFKIDLETIPENATIHMATDPETKKKYIYSWHVAAHAVIEDDEKCYLAGMDEQSYFIAELPCMVNSMQEAFDCLKPGIVKDAEKSGVEIKRQGEWFAFGIVGGKIAKKLYKQMNQKVILPGDGNTHVATRACMLSELIFDKKTFELMKTTVISLDAETMLFSGAISHPEHKTLRVSKASKPEIYVLARNTALNSWSVSGVD
jgi:hypothetical protein